MATSSTTLTTAEQLVWRLRDWQAAGVWEQLHHRLLDWLGDDAQVDWSRASIDSVSVRARRGGN